MVNALAHRRGAPSDDPQGSVTADCCDCRLHCDYREGIV
jgi:hypothetical protein